MESDGSTPSFDKIPKLHKSTDYLPWKRRMIAVITHGDPMKTWLDDRPAENATQTARTKWITANAKAKSMIVLGLGESVQKKTASIIDDDEGSARQLWEELKKIFTISSHQSITNLQQKIEALRYEDGKSWEKHISIVLGLVDELAAMVSCNATLRQPSKTE